MEHTGLLDIEGIDSGGHIYAAFEIQLIERYLLRQEVMQKLYSDMS